MQLQQLIGELQTLALAYPPETPVRFSFRDMEGEIIALNVRSDDHGVAVMLEEQS